MDCQSTEDVSTMISPLVENTRYSEKVTFTIQPILVQEPAYPHQLSFKAYSVHQRNDHIISLPVDVKFLSNVVTIVDCNPGDTQCNDGMGPHEKNFRITLDTTLGHSTGSQKTIPYFDAVSYGSSEYDQVKTTIPTSLASLKEQITCVKLDQVDEDLDGTCYMVSEYITMGS